MTYQVQIYLLQYCVPFQWPPVHLWPLGYAGGRQGKVDSDWTQLGDSLPQLTGSGRVTALTWPTHSTGVEQNRSISVRRSNSIVKNLHHHNNEWETGFNFILFWNLYVLLCLPPSISIHWCWTLFTVPDAEFLLLS